MPTAGNSPTALSAADALNKGRPQHELIGAQWMPVHIEPITFSGERITVGVAIVPANGERPLVINALNHDALAEVFGQYGKHLFSLASTVLGELQAFLHTGGKLEAWSSAVEGVYPGKTVTTKNTSVAAIKDSALKNASIFSAKRKAKADEESNSERALSEFHSTIIRKVTAVRETYKSRFNAKVSLYGKSSTKMSYLGTHLAMNFASLDTSSPGHSQQRDVALRKIMQLNALREMHIDHHRDKLMMGLWVPQKTLKDKQEDRLLAYTDELEFAAARVGVEYRLAENPDQFVAEILADH